MCILGRCTAQRARGVGDCDESLGVRWNGAGCEELRGCECEGEECDSLYASVASCETLNEECVP